MATQLQLLAEANRRGILPSGKKALFDEATRRGLIGETQPQERQPATLAIPGEFQSEIKPSGVTEQQEIQPIPETAESALVPGRTFGEVERAEPAESVTRTLTNIPGSAVEFGKNMAQPFIHPVQTAKSLGELTKGIIALAVPGEQESEKSARAVGEFLKNRYGSVDAIQETFQTDPVGFTADIASVLLAGGFALKTVGKISKVKTVSKVGEAVTRIGLAFDPSSVLLKGLGVPAKLIPKATPSDLYESSVKFSTRLSAKERAALTSTALDNAIMPNIKGLRKLGDGINEINTEISSMIDAAVDSGKVIPIDRFTRGFRALQRHVLGASGKPIINEKAVAAIRKQFFIANRKLKRGELTPKEAQLLKQQIYKETASYFSTVAENPVSIKAQQLIARNAREALEEILPEIKNLNKSDGALIALRGELEKSVNRITNRDILGIGIPLKGTAGGVSGGAPGFLSGVSLGLLDAPQVKAKLAIVANKLQKQGVTLNPNSAAVRLGLVQIGRGSEDENIEVIGP